MAERRWPTLAELNGWLASRCRAAWEEMRHPQWSQLTLAECLQDERVRLMPLPRAFDGYIEQPVRVSEQPVRVSATGLIHVQRNRYSVPTEHAHRVVSVHLYPFELWWWPEAREVARHARLGGPFSLTPKFALLIDGAFLTKALTVKNKKFPSTADIDAAQGR